MAYKRKYRRSKKSYRRRGRYARKSRRSFQSRVKRVLMKNSETKYYESGLDNMQLYHNLGFGTALLPPTTVSSIPLLFNFWANVYPGTGRNERIGDSIKPVGMKIEMFLASKADRPNTMYRIIVARLPKEYDGTIVTAQWNPFQSSPTLNSMILAADKDKGVKFLYDRLIRMSGTQYAGNQSGNWSSREYTRVKRMWIRRKNSRPIIFNQNLQKIVNNPIAVYVIPYEQYSTLQTDNIASVSVRARIYYKDL